MTFYLEIGAALIAATLLLAWLGRRSALRLMRERRIHVDRFKLKRRHADIELEVFGSEPVVTAIKGYAKEHHVSIEAARRQARLYLMEIVPKFNLLAYYRFGAPVAKAILNLLYRVVVERRPVRELNERIPKDAVIVYMINHRSNADYVLVAHMLFRFISLSYAVGEWARVWPLNHLFKWFGGYFVRRRYREPLYHAILSSFVQTITRHGVTQGVFIEGGLTRDGSFLEPKVGMLDYLVTAKRDPAFREAFYIIPTAVNYDRTLEDRNLTQELTGTEDRMTRIEKLRTTFEFLFKNLLRSILRRFKRYGYAIVSFGTPILVDDFVARNPGVLAPAFEERKPHLRALASRIMNEISAAIPVTPVAVAATVFQHAGGALPDSAMAAGIQELREAMRHRVWLLREKTGEEIWHAARQVLELRHLIARDPEGWRWEPGELLLRDYYANSLLTFEEASRRRAVVAPGNG